MSSRLYVAVALSFCVSASAPAERVYVASNHVRIIDPDRAEVVAVVDLGQSTVRTMIADETRGVMWVAHSRGVTAIDSSARRTFDLPTARAVTAVVPTADELLTLEHASGGPYEVVAYAGRAPVSPRRAFSVPLRTHTLVPLDDDRLLSLHIGRGVLSTMSGEGVVENTFAMLADAPRPGGAYVFAIALSPDRSRVYAVFAGSDAHVEVRRTDDLGLIARFPIEATQSRDAEVSPDGDRLYIAAIDHVSVVDLRAQSVHARIDLGLPHQQMAIAADGRTLYVANPIFDSAGGSVAVVDTEQLRLRDRIPVPDMGPVQVAVGP